MVFCNVFFHSLFWSDVASAPGRGWLQIGKRKLTYHMQKISEFGNACCHFACASVGLTCALLASFSCATCGPPTAYEENHNHLVKVHIGNARQVFEDHL